MDSWLQRVDVPSWWNAHRSLRMATDCSGMGVPEIGERICGGVKHVWTCDNSKPSQKWLQGLLGDRVPVLNDMMERLYKEDSIFACDIWGYPRAFFRGWPDKLDVYVCSIIDKPFPDRPFRNYQLYPHPNYDDLSTKTGDKYADSVFSATLRTIQTVHPRSFVLESATSAAKTDVYNKALECLEKEYLVVKKHCKTRCFGVPQMGARVYYVGLCYEELDPAFKGKSDRILRDFVQSQLVKLQTSSDPRNHAGYNKSFDFRKFLQKEGLEVRVGQSTSSSSSESEESSMSSESMSCTCAVGAHCLAHPCKCSFCKKHGQHAKKCRWRINHREYSRLQSTKKKRRDYLKLWRRVKNDNTLKKAPDYFCLAARRGIDTMSPRCPRQRVALQELSYERNLFTPSTILNLGKSFGRCQIRADGLVPTLGKGCLGFFLPAYASYLTVDQLLCLSGLSPQQCKICYDLAKYQKNNDMDWMLGNTMTLSVVGPVLMVTLGMLRP